jgi:hypothetical protein
MNQLTSGFNGLKIPALLFLFYALIIDVSIGQTITDQSKANENIFLVKTKQFNEFIDRFNYKTDFYGNRIDSSFMSKMSREKLIATLFDLKDTRLKIENNNSPLYYKETKVQFMGEVIKNNYLINKYSANIIAEARSRITFNGKPAKVSLFLNQEMVGKDMIKWIILDARGEILNFLKTDTSLIRFLSPTSNETDFINLRRALEDIDYLQYFASKDYKIDYLTVFFYLLNQKKIKFEYVEEVIYHIIDLPGWCIKVKEFNRSEMNSGWLISDVMKNDIGLSDYLITLGK